MIANLCLDTPTLLMALLPARGPRAALASTRAVLKWALDEPLVIARSTLEFVSATGREIARYEDAFGLTTHSRWSGPLVRVLADESRRPGEANVQRWRLNEWAVEAPMTLPDSAESSLHVTWLPLQLPLEDDPHVLAEFIHVGSHPLDMATGVREARFWVDGEPFQSSAGEIWNGQYLLEPGHAALRRFRLADFPGAPATGTHEVAIELFGRRSSPVSVSWHGTPRSNSAPFNGNET